MVLSTQHPIEGSWLPVRAELAGEPAPALALAKQCLVLNASSYSIFLGNDVSDSGDYALGCQAEIQTIVLASKNGANQGRTIPSIYQLVGDRLRICFGLDGTAPTCFAAPTGSCFYLVSYRRKT